LFFYTVYGLIIRSELPFPELEAIEQALEDVAICLHKLNDSEQSPNWGTACFLGETTGVGTFLVRNGDEIIVDPAPGVDELLLRTVILGPVLAVLLRQRGLTVLHASGIAINSGAVAFLGGSGWGKSTLAEAFYNHGYGVVTDDVMAVRVNGSYPKALPGYPSIKLYPHVATLLECDNDAKHLPLPQTEKRAYRVALRFSQKSLPLQRIYVLTVGECNEIEPLPPQEAFVELVRNSRAVSLLRDLDSRNTHLHQCSRLVAEVPICRLKRRPVLTDLPEVVRLIEEDLAKNVCSA
jgi:hypothetical protein